MKSEHHYHSLQGAGNPHSLAPSLPVYAFCEVCGEADEQAHMTEGMCPNCIGVIREGLREDRRRNRAVDRFDAITAVVIGFWTAIIIWRLFR